MLVKKAYNSNKGQSNVESAGQNLPVFNLVENSTMDNKSAMNLKLLVI